MPSCVYRKCKNYSEKSRKDADVTFHAFPSDELLKQKWISKVREERSESDWTPSKHSTICSDHFRPEDKYKTAKGYTRLKKTVVPVVEPDYVPRVGTPNSLNDVNISDMESIFDSPRKAILKKLPFCFTFLTPV